MGNRQSTIRNAFTLIELMISIALVLLLLIGVNQVFRLTGDAVGAGQVLSGLNRDLRAAQGVLADDFRGIDSGGPFILSCRLSRWGGPGDDVDIFLSFSDYMNDRDARAKTRDIDGRDSDLDARANTEGDTNVPYELNTGCNYDSRVHRVDSLMFPVRGMFRRQTGDSGLFVSATTSNQGFVYLGHVALPRRWGGAISGYYYPGEAGSSAPDPSFAGGFASEWVLGRVRLLLRDPSQIGSEQAYQRPAINASSTFIGPISSGSTSQDGSRLSQSVYDLGVGSIDTVRSDISAYEQATGRTDWWQWMIYDYYSPDPTRPRLFRFECNPFVSRPMTSAIMAKTTPYFMGNVSQFIVEYAGDYLVQDNNRASGSYGRIQGAGNDGKVDYIVDRTVPGRTVERIRWYGHARDVNADGVILGSKWRPGGVWVTPDQLVDTVPLGEVLAACRNNGLAYAAPVNAPREVEVPTDLSGAWRARYMDYTDPTYDAGRPGQAMAKYTCVWRTGCPDLIRILIRQDDPNGRIKEGQWSEMVFSLK
jgi:prepilin-type N-terminal cleavage/methylation domain-containing protein